MSLSTQDIQEAQRHLREYRILDEIEKDANVSQRDLARSVGIAVGRTNQVLKRLVRKGHVKTRRINAKRVTYYLTPQGITEKLRLVVCYARTTISFFSCVRALTRERLAELTRGRPDAAIAIVGTGELAEAAYLSARELGLRLAAVYDDARVGETWFGCTIQALTDAGRTPATVLVVAVLEDLELPCPPVTAELVELRLLLSDHLSRFARRIAAEAREGDAP